MSDNTEKPISIKCRTSTSAEKLYIEVDKVELSIAFCVKKFINDSNSEESYLRNFRR